MSDRAPHPRGRQNLAAAGAEIASLTAQVQRCLRRGAYLHAGDTHLLVSNLLNQIWANAEMIVFVMKSEGYDPHQLESDLDDLEKG